ncbi:hypothetical protein BOTCAL_0114g00160 [Botryotinia calthae]|uniref:Uncharacterized protein n=1 Tax=Botryotinia calthae TaxID=38488 RepID=A0A4Y8D552_9HELO|nr:hypothetical protein BOTCAL_0114g00160 [Botryotinia calthae]
MVPGFQSSIKCLDEGLFVPVEILVCQLLNEEGTKTMWQVPSTLITAIDEGNNGLLTTTQILDRKLEELIDFVGGGV